jgi:predicted RNase H-like HicB family nuclease
VERPRGAIGHGVDVSKQLRYSIVIEWSGEDQVFVVSLPEWGRLVHTHGATYEEALQSGKGLIEALITARQAEGEALPEPREFSVTRPAIAS